MAQKTPEFKISKNTRVIKNHKKALVYNAFFGTAMICHTDMVTLLKNIKQTPSACQLKKRYHQPDLEAKLSQLMAKGFIVDKSQLETNPPYSNFQNEKIETGSLINKLRLNVSLACNMRCTYCYVDTKNESRNNALMTWDTAKTAINEFFNLQKQHHHKFCIIRFFGGEPLLNWPVIKRSLDHIQRTRQDILVHFILNTNSTIYSQKIADSLSQHRVGIAISLDGNKMEHNLFRRFKSGKPTYNIIAQNIKKFLTASCTLGIETTLGDHNIHHLDGLIDQIATWNKAFNANIPLSFQHLAMVNKTNLDTLPANEKTKKLMAVMDYARQNKVKADTGMIHFSINALKGQRNTGRYCRALGGELCIYPNGDVYPCGALKIKLGNITDLTSVFKSPVYHNLANRTAGTIAECQGCDIEAFCAGGCAADAFAANKTLNAPMANCELEKLVFKAVVKKDILTSATIS
jgi:uncharacterized protein